MTKVLEYLSEGEAKVVRSLVSEILKRNLRIAVNDGESFVTKITNDEGVILEALGSTGEDLIFVFEGEQKVKRCVYHLIYGNADDGSELFSDWTGNVLSEEILQSIGYLE